MPMCADVSFEGPLRELHRPQGSRSVKDEKPSSPGYLWRPGSSPQDNPLHVTVAVVIGLIMLGVVVLAILT
jgi:hypothetical protein